MENLTSLKSLPNKGDKMIRLDLTDAYLTVPMHPDSQKFLRFLLGDKTFQFTAMPFGLNLAPRLFTKIMKRIVASLRSRGVRLIIYLDDILIIAWSIETLNHHKTLVIDLLESLGFLINYKKSNLTPSQQIVFLGMLVDSASMQFILHQAKSVHIQKECCSTVVCGIRTSRILSPGRMIRPTSLSSNTNPSDQSSLEVVKLQYTGRFDTKSDLVWWISALRTQQGVVLFH